MRKYRTSFPSGRERVPNAVHLRVSALRVRSGQSLLEVTLGTVILALIVLVLVDLGIAVLACGMNSSACQNIVRAAGTGDPTQANNRARAVLDHIKRSSSSQLITDFRIVEPVETTIADSPLKRIVMMPPQRRPPNPGGPVTGTATATTEVSVEPFVLNQLLGHKGEKLKFKSQQSFPIRFIMPPVGESDQGALSP